MDRLCVRKIVILIARHNLNYNTKIWSPDFLKPPTKKIREFRKILLSVTELTHNYIIQQLI